MKTISVSAALVMALVQSPSAQDPSHTPAQRGPDLSGLWSRDSANGPAEGSRWGTRVHINQSSVDITVRTEAGRSERLRVDGTESAEVVEVKGCKATIRIKKATFGRDDLTITTWLVDKPACIHGEDEDYPTFTGTGPILISEVRGGPRRIESIISVRRDGNAMTVETTNRSQATGEASTSTTVYRRDGSK